MESPHPSLPILILGAGPAGLSLAQSLHHDPIPGYSFRLFERETPSSRRTQGYRLRLAPIGISSLRYLLPQDVFENLSITSGILPQGTKMAPGAEDCLDAFTGEMAVDEPVAGANGTSGGVAGVWKKFGKGIVEDAEEILAVDRTISRKVLAMGLEDKIEWGKEVVSVKDQGGDGVLVRFSDGEEVRGSLVIGADGSRSKARKAVTPEMKLLETEGRWIFGKTKITDELERRCPRLLQKFTVVKSKRGDTDIALIEEPMRFRHKKTSISLPDDYVYWVIQTRKDYFGAEDGELLKLSGRRAADLAQKMTAGWHPSFRGLFELQDEENTAMLRVVSSPPKLPYWESSHITLIGDAAHVMSPTAAVGATTAFRDAAELLKCLRRNGVSKASIASYEKQMRAYAEEGLARSATSGKWLFGMKDLKDMEPLDDFREM